MLELHALSMSHSSSYFLVLSLLTYFLTHRSVLCSMLYRLHCRRLASRFRLLVFSRCADVLSCVRLLHHYRKAFWTESGCIKLFERIPFYPISIRLYLIHFLKKALFSLEALIASLAFQQQHALAGFPLRCSIKQQAICKFRWLEVSIIKIQPLVPDESTLILPWHPQALPWLPQAFSSEMWNRNSASQIPLWMVAAECGCLQHHVSNLARYRRLSFCSRGHMEVLSRMVSLRCVRGCPLTIGERLQMCTSLIVTYAADWRWGWVRSAWA